MEIYTLRELMAISATRYIRNGDIVFCGTGISLLAAMAAKHISAPESVVFFETGGIDSELEELPLAVGDPRVMHRTTVNGSLADSFAIMQNPFTGKHVVGVMGAAQIDRYGNLNSTVIGDYHSPRIRFSGNGGAPDVASFVSRTIIFMQHEKRKFVKKLDYFSSPGWLTGHDSRKKAGLSGGGPEAVITDKAIMGFDEVTREMILLGYYPGYTPDQIQEHMSFEVDTSRAKEVEPPTKKELRILREVCDPQRLILGD